MAADPTPSPTPLTSNPWRAGCWCEHNRKPCQYHEGYEDAMDEVSALTAQVEKLHGAAQPDISIAAQAAEVLEDADAFITEHYPDAEMHLRLTEMVTMIRTSKRRKTDGFDTWNAIVAQRDEALATIHELVEEATQVNDKWHKRLNAAEAENAKLRDVVEASRKALEELVKSDDTDATYEASGYLEVAIDLAREALERIDASGNALLARAALDRLGDHQ